MFSARILHLNKAGLPTEWISREDAAILYTKDRVLWELGTQSTAMRGGINRNGSQSQIDVAPIIATRGKVTTQSFAPVLSNRFLFRRDGDRCLYCGDRFHFRDLSRDHVIPKAQGGKDIWTNVVTACKRCNHHKGNRTPEQADMPLLAIPFVPNRHEYFYLANRKILADQMDFLASSFSKQLNWK